MVLIPCEIFVLFQYEDNTGFVKWISSVFLHCYPERFVYLFFKFLVKFTSKQSGPELFILWEIF